MIVNCCIKDVLVTCHNFVTFAQYRCQIYRHLMLSMSMSYHALVRVRLLTHSLPPFRPAAIVFVRGFRSSPVAASHGAFQLAHSSPRAMDTKQKHAEDKPVIYSAYALKTLMSSAITTYGSAEVALLHIMRTYDFSVSLLQGLLNSLCILFLFSELI
jgi:hypothetical protein